MDNIERGSSHHFQEMLRLFPHFRIFEQGNQVIWLIIALRNNLYTDQYGLGGREKKIEIKKKKKLTVRRALGGGEGGNSSHAIHFFVLFSLH